MTQPKETTSHPPQPQLAKEATSMTETTTQPQTPRPHPRDPAMAAPDPAMFGSLSRDENAILQTHLTSGWYKQAAVYPGLSEPWRETSAVLDDLHGAWSASWYAEHEAEAEP